MEESLRSQLLIASPRLADYFRRTVVLVLEHNEDGAMGLVLNRPSDAPVAEAVPGLADLGEPGAVVHVGGPVQPQAVIALGEFDDPEDASRLVAGDLGVVPEDVVHPGLLGGWLVSKPPVPRRTPDEVAR
jgi:putative transcriptional regulator